MIQNDKILIDEYVKNKSKLIERRLDQLVPENSTSYKTLLRAARYSLLNGGKRLRPILTLATAETLGAPLEQALDPACALEMIHTYSLIHDDLPCMDDDDFRRGKPSLHKAFPEGQAVLAGDFLLTFAFEVLSDAPSLTAQQKVDLIRLLAKNSGAEGMIGGQVMDLEAEGQSIDSAMLRNIHERKTGALITSAIEFGGIIANAKQEHLALLRRFGNEIGLTFQIADDILDVTSQKNSDVKNKKSTYVTLLGIEQAKEASQKHYKKALEALEQLPFDTSLLFDLSNLIA
jgi:geranylgeranyl diphosphate synthase, type II